MVIGGIVGSITPALFTVFCVGELLYNFYKKIPINKDDIIFFSIITLASAAIGVGFAAATTAIFPGAMLGLGSAALAGATIGVIAPIAGLFVADKVEGYIISPIIEHFSSKGEGYE